MNDIEAFRNKLIEANSCHQLEIDAPVTSSQRDQLIHVDLVVAHQALNRMLDNLEIQLKNAKSNDSLIHYSQLWGELYAYFNGLTILLKGL